MDLSSTEQCVLAYWLTHGAQEFAMVGRFWPYGELTMLIEDKIRVAVRPFGSKAGAAAPGAARAFLDSMIAREGFSTVKNKFGGSMHQYQPDAYRSHLKALQDADPIVQKAKADGEGVWAEAFGAL
jgi:hypothetical protein